MLSAEKHHTWYIHTCNRIATGFEVRADCCRDAAEDATFVCASCRSVRRCGWMRVSHRATGTKRCSLGCTYMNRYLTFIVLELLQYNSSSFMARVLSDNLSKQQATAAATGRAENYSSPVRTSFPLAAYCMQQLLLLLLLLLVIHQLIAVRPPDNSACSVFDNRHVVNKIRIFVVHFLLHFKAVLPSLLVAPPGTRGSRVHLRALFIFCATLVRLGTTPPCRLN